MYRSVGDATRGRARDRRRGDIGAEVARLLRERGAEVIAADRVASDDVSLLDVTSPESWERIIAAIERRHGRLDMLVNAAGIEGPAGDLWEQSPRTSPRS
jgi:NAD(P)-dependent dehydrogenase (short-subunit alcohol dehydrogenase family)